MISSGVLISPRTFAVGSNIIRLLAVILPIMTPSTMTLFAFKSVLTLPVGPIYNCSACSDFPSKLPSTVRLPLI